MTSGLSKGQGEAIDSAADPAAISGDESAQCWPDLPDFQLHNDAYAEKDAADQYLYEQQLAATPLAAAMAGISVLECAQDLVGQCIRHCPVARAVGVE